MASNSIEAVDHFLPAPGAGMNRLEADRAAVEQMLRRRPCIVEGKHAEAIKHHAAHALGKQRRPALRGLGMLVQQAMADGFGADEIVVDVTAPQILRAFDAQLPGGGGADQGLGRQQIKIAAAVQFAGRNCRRI